MRSSPGYIALTSAIITSVLIMIIVFAMSGAAILNRSDILDATHKERSLALAEACAEVALLKLAENPNYLGNEPLVIGEEQCQILPLETQGSDKIIKTEANAGGATSRIKVAARSQNLDINSWEETASF
ncbi:MAG TPA: hypothetical protein VJA63_00555 [Candidatus Paceibacterota bacterium]